MTRECFLLLFVTSATACTGKDSGDPPGSDNGNVIAGQNGTTGQNGGPTGNGSQNGSTDGNGGTAGNGSTTANASTDGNGGTAGSGNTTGNGTTGNGSGASGTGNASGPSSDECQATSAPDYQLARTDLNAQLSDGSAALVNVELVTCTGLAGYRLVIEGAEPAISLHLPVIADDSASMTVLGAAPNAPAAVPSATFNQRYGTLPLDLSGYTHVGFDAYASLDMDPPYLRISVIGYADGECEQCTADGCSQCGGWEGGKDLLKIQ
jgi:hypothetical protein